MKGTELISPKLLSASCSARWRLFARTPAPLVKIQSVEDGSATVTVDYWQRGAAPILPDVLASLRATFPEAKITVVSTGDLPAPQAT